MAKRNYITSYQIIVIIGIINLVIMCTAGWVITGTIISGILLLIVGVPLILQWVRSRTPFIILVSLDPYEIPPRKKRQWTKRVVLDLGDNIVTIAVIPREGTSWDKINCRLVTRRFSPRFTRIWEYNDADMKAVQVSELEDIVYREHGEEWDYPYFESEEDTVGGYWGIYSPALPVIGGNLAWYCVYIRANDMWEGYLSFRGVLG
ncbi:unnamed protein product, partial [marine sediment metagenome]